MTEGEILRDTVFKKKFWFDFIFNFIILIIVFQIFLSIIKDQFARQREELQKHKDIIQKICKVCEIRREDIEKIYNNHKNAFEIHINHDHNVYGYISYLNYLNGKKKEARNQIEQYIKEKQLSGNYLYLPKRNCFKMIEKNYKIKKE